MVLSFSVFISAESQTFKDESPSDATFMAFQKRLSEAIASKSLAMLKPLFADTIFESNNGCGWPGCAKADFFNYYFLADSSEDWDIVRRIQEYGFFLVGDSLFGIPLQGKAFYGPAYHKDFDIAFDLVVLGKNVNIRKAPSLKSPVIHRATFGKLHCDCNIETRTDETYVWDVDGLDWVQVRLADGRTGYVAMKFTSEAFQKRILVVKIDGRWQITRYYHPPGC